jgi:asparaginyl-tRNA synthetase
MKVNSNTTQLVRPLKSWKKLDTHYRKALFSDWYKIISRLQNKFVCYTHEFYKNKCYDFQMFPVTTGSTTSPMDVGSDSLPVKVCIDGIETYLADSMQFFLEFACRLNNNGNYYIAPSFRGELADKRHLCQFYHSEAEILGNLKDVIFLVEEYLEFLISHYFRDSLRDIIRITKNDSHIIQMLNMLKTGLPSCTFSEAINLLQNNRDSFVYKNGILVITSVGEKLLIKHFGGAVWLLYPEHMSVPFYQARNKENPKLAQCADLLFGIGETVGAGQRHYLIDNIIESLQTHSIDISEYEWYIDMKSLIPMQTSGFGMGVERFLLWLLQHDDIRDMQLFPRFNGQRSKY